MSSNHYWIMNATELFGGGATNIKGCLDVWHTGGEYGTTILVCRRQTKRGQPMEEGGRIFVVGAGGSYVPKDAELPYRSWYTQDTGGMFNGLKDYGLLIENVIHVTSEGKLQPRNMVGLNENRRAWCMK